MILTINRLHMAALNEQKREKELYVNESITGVMKRGNQVSIEH